MSLPSRDSKLNGQASYAGSVDRLFAWQKQARLSDKELARLAEVAPNTVKNCRARRRLFCLETMYLLRDKLGESWWTYVTASGGWQTDAEFEARAAALETQARMLAEDLRKARRG